MTIRPLSEYERRVWPVEMVRAYESQRDMTPDERRFLIDGYLAAVRIKCAAADEAAREGRERAA